MSNHERESSRSPDGDAALDRAWQQLSDEQPPSALDAAIIAAAHKSIQDRDGQAQVVRASRSSRSWLIRWQPLAAAAGVAGLAFVLVQSLPRDHDVATSPRMEERATTPAAAAEKTVRPATREAIANVVGRAEVLAAVFALGAVCLAWARGSRAAAWGAAACVFLACGSKETGMVALPLVVLAAFVGRLRTDRRGAVDVAGLYRAERCRRRSGREFSPAILVLLQGFQQILPLRQGVSGRLAESLAAAGAISHENR